MICGRMLKPCDSGRKQHKFGAKNKSARDQLTAGHVTIKENGMAENEMGPWSEGGPTDVRLAKWVDSVGTVALPLLAGFSITSLVVVSDDAVNFQWPGATILALAFAALALIVAVQCAYHARVYLSRKDPEYKLGPRWAKRTRRFYDAGLFALLISLGLVVVPRHIAGIQDCLRLAAVALTCVALLCEVIWVWRDKWLRSE
jgi:hypothetical protein